MQDYAVKVATYQISQYKADIKPYDCPEMSLYKCKWDTQEIKGICDTVRKAAHYEKRHTEQKRQILSLTGKLYCCSHYEAAAYGKESAPEGTISHPDFQNLLRSRLNIQRRHSGKKCNT